MRNDERFETFIRDILQIEKGYSDRENDRGGATRFGVTEFTARKHGYTGDMKSLPLEKALSIYKNVFWRETRICEIENAQIAFECLDNAINMGPYRAIKFLQGAFNIVNYDFQYGKDLKKDGVLGPASLSAINSHPDPGRVLVLINGYQAKHYIELAEKSPSQRSNVFGWFNKRVEI